MFLKRLLAGIAAVALLVIGTVAPSAGAEQTQGAADWTALTGSEPITVAQKGGRELVVVPDTAQLYVRDSTTGVCWYAKPDNLDSTVGMKGAEKLRVRSYLLADVIDQETSNTVISLTSEADSVTEGGMTVESTEDKLRFTFTFPLYQLTVPLVLSLTETGLSASVDLGGVQEGERYRLRALSILPFFDAGYYEEEGFLLVPDGSGAIIRFNNGKGGFQKYTQEIYGYDYAISRYSYNGKEQEVRMPLFGIGHANRYTLGIVSDGVADAAVVAGPNTSKNHYNYAYAQFAVRNRDTLVYVNEYRTDLDIFQKTELPQRTVAVEYLLTTAESPTYVDMAEGYRQYLLENGTLGGLKEQETAPVYVDLYGATVRTKPFLGIPMEQTEVLTTFAQAEAILRELHDSGVQNVVLRYRKWSSATIWGKLNGSYSPAACLGGKKGLTSLKETVREYGYTLYLDADPVQVYRGGVFSFFTDYAQNIRNYTVELYPYDACTNMQDTTGKVSYLVRKSLLSTQIQKTHDKIAQLGVDGFSVSGTGTLYTDFRKTDAWQDETRSVMQESLERLSGSLMIDGGNLYTLKNADHVINAPSSGSGFDVEDASVPFYPIVLHGYIDYANEANNAAADITTAYLRSLETGASLRFEWTYASANVLSGSDDARLYYANYENWKQRAESMIAESAAYYRDIAGHCITAHERLADGVYRTVYDNGVYILVNYGEESVDTAHGRVAARGFLTGRQMAE